MLLLILLLAAVFLVWRERIRKQKLHNLADLALIDRLLPATIPRYPLQSGLWLAAIFMLMIALARPVWGVNMDIIEVQGVSVVVVMDVSNSMAAQDMLPSRLERAKLAAHELFEQLNGNEMGLVLFAGTAFAYFPLTTDALSASTFLDGVSIHSISQQGTVLESAINEALDMFGPESPAARIIVLMTDGESHEGDIERALNRASEMNVTIYPIGYGSAEGAPVPVVNEQGETITYRADSGSELILSRLDETTLQLIADRTGGIYQPASATGAEITNVGHIIQQSETGVLDTRAATRGVERFEIFTLLAVLILTLEIVLPKRQRRAA
jgi:Ca-activated chloride channel family protein